MYHTSQIGLPNREAKLDAYTSSRSHHGSVRIVLRSCILGTLDELLASYLVLCQVLRPRALPGADLPVRGAKHSP
jgi:hypothetical protein